MAKPRRTNGKKGKCRRYWKGVRQHEARTLARGEDPRPTATRSQVRASYGKPVI